jgi:hypothetical protein
MKKTIYGIAGLLIAFALIFDGSAMAMTSNNKPMLAYGYGTGFNVCYRPVKVFRVYVDRFGYKYVRFMGMKNMCAVMRTSCRGYNAFKFGWYSSFGQAKNAAYRCNRHWY